GPQHGARDPEQRPGRGCAEAHPRGRREGGKARGAIHSSAFRKRGSVNVGFAPKATEVLCCCELTGCATTGLMHRNKGHSHSITSSARPSSERGTVRPSSLAVLKLMTSWTFVDCWTGRSEGFARFRIRPMYIPAWRFASIRLAS